MSSEGAAEPTYSLYRRGIELLEDGNFEHATAPLAEAARRAPEKTSVREALGRAMLAAERSGQRATAEQLARRYLAQHPGGPHARSAERLLRPPRLPARPPAPPPPSAGGS